MGSVFFESRHSQDCFFLQLEASRLVVVVVIVVVLLVVVVVITVFVISLNRCWCSDPNGKGRVDCSTNRCCNSIDVFYIRLLHGLHMTLPVVRSL